VQIDIIPGSLYGSSGMDTEKPKPRPAESLKCRQIEELRQNETPRSFAAMSFILIA
jgi:hypothetical protein